MQRSAKHGSVILIYRHRLLSSRLARIVATITLLLITRETLAAPRQQRRAMASSTHDSVAGQSSAGLSSTNASPEGPQAPPKSSQQPVEGLFDRFIGTWDVDYQTFDRDGKRRANRGQVTYSKILDGQAIQETWTSDSHLKEPRPFGTSILFFDPKLRCWTEVWIYPALGMTTIIHGGSQNGRIVLDGRDETGAMLRWSFNEIQADSFVWRGEISRDEGRTWTVQGENRVRRHSA